MRQWRWLERNRRRHLRRVLAHGSNHKSRHAAKCDGCKSHSHLWLPLGSKPKALVLLRWLRLLLLACLNLYRMDCVWSLRATATARPDVQGTGQAPSQMCRAVEMHRPPMPVAQAQRVSPIPRVLLQLLLKLLLLQRFQALQAVAEHEEAKDRCIDVCRVDEVLVRDRVVLAEEAWAGRAAAIYYICKGHTLWHTVPRNCFVSGDTCLREESISFGNPQAMTASPYPVCQKHTHTATAGVCCVLRHNAPSMPAVGGGAGGYGGRGGSSSAKEEPGGDSGAKLGGAVVLPAPLPSPSCRSRRAACSRSGMQASGCADSPSRPDTCATRAKHVCTKRCDAVQAYAAAIRVN